MGTRCPILMLCVLTGMPLAALTPASAQEPGLLRTSFLVGDFFTAWRSARGDTVLYRGIPLFTANPAEFVVHQRWQKVFYRTENSEPRAVLSREAGLHVLTIHDRTADFTCEKRIIIQPDGTLRLEHAYELLGPERAELQVLWGLGKAWIDKSHYRIIVGGQPREGELTVPATGRIDPWGGATEQIFTTDFGTLTLRSQTPLNLLCTPDGGSLWWAQALEKGVRYTQTIEVSIQPGPAADTGLTLSTLEWTDPVRDGRAHFSVDIARAPTGPREVTLRVEYQTDGTPLAGPVAVALTDQPQHVACTAAVERTGPLAFALVITDAQDGRQLLRLAPLTLQADPWLQIMPRLSFYTDEPQAELLADLAPDLPLDGLTLETALDSETATSTTPTGRRVLVPLDLSRLSEGTHRVSCRLLRNAEVMVEAATELRKLPPRPNAVKIDNCSRSLVVNGLPLIPFGFYTYYPPKPGIVDEEVVRGFNLFSPYHGGPHTGEALTPIRQYMDRCAQVGMKVNYHLMWANLPTLTDEQRAQLRAEIELFRDHPALLSWYIADEPGLDRVAPLEQIYQLVKELDPYHPVTIVFYQGGEHARAFANALDIVMGDPYPIPHRPVTDVAAMADALNQAYNFRKPLWIVPQAFGGNEWWRREPTAREQRVMTYLALIHGARGIQYFIRSPRISFPKSPVMWAECGKLALETAELTPALTSPEIPPRVQASPATVHAAAYLDRGILTILAANTQNRPENLELKLEGVDYSGEANVLFEDRTVQVTAGVIQEPIDAFGTRAYAIPIGPLPADDLAVAPGNLTVNPSWEDLPSVGTPDGHYASVPFGATLFADSRTARHGRHSLRMTAPSDADTPSISPFPVSLQSGQEYRVSLWAKALTEGVKLKLSLGNLQSQEFTLTTEWREYAFTAKPDRDARLSPGLALVSAGTAWLDLLQVVPVAPQ